MKATGTSLWPALLENIKNNIGPERFDLWLKNTEFLALQDGAIHIGVPNLFILEWLEENYLEAFQRAAQEILGQKKVGVRFRIIGPLFQDLRRQGLKEGAHLLQLAEEDAARSSGRHTPSLRPDMTLENFVVGPCNKVAYAACCQVVENKPSAYNPLFLHGPVGLGKTHLLQGICQRLKKKRRQHKALYTSGESFTNQFIYAVRRRNLDAFRHKFRTLDVLIIDDIHFIANKKATQEEFVHTFNALAGPGRQIVMASNSHPKLITKVIDGLINRFLAGMIIQLERPDYNTRLAILKAKLKEKQQTLPTRVLEFVAKNLPGSVRELEGAINTLVAYTALARKRLTLTEAAEVLSALLDRKAGPSVVDIESCVSAMLNVTIQDLHSKKRSRSTAFARHLAIYLIRKHTQLSFQEIASHFGGLHHATAIFACRKIETGLKKDSELKRLVEKLEAKISSR